MSGSNLLHTTEKPRHRIFSYVVGGRLRHRHPCRATTRKAPAMRHVARDSHVVPLQVSPNNSSYDTRLRPCHPLCILGDDPRNIASGYSAHTHKMLQCATTQAQQRTAPTPLRLT